MSGNEIGALDFFIAGVPPNVLFRLDSEKVIELVASSSDPHLLSNPVAELGIIGLAAYFEAFCKNQFAAIVNICPDTLNNFVSKRDNVALGLKDILKISKMIHYKLGSLLAEQYDFGSAKTINNLYKDLLNITPFSKKEADKYGEFLNDRNLLVHHGGIYTFRYQGQKLAERKVKGIAHWDSLSISKKDFAKWLGFIQTMTKKIVTATYKALEQYVTKQNIELSTENKKALRYLSSLDEDNRVS